MTDLVATPTVDPAPVERTVPLRDLGIARENLRFNHPPDDDIPLLVATLKAAGQLERLTVRPGRGRKERAFMALNGRRRLLAFGLLLADGDIDEDHPVLVRVETDPVRQSAAALLTNTALPTQVADVIAAIGQMMKAKLTIEVIARALGHAEIDIRRLAALAVLPPVAIDALRAGKLTLKQMRSLARLSSRTQQIELAKAALAGLGFQEWRILDRAASGRVTIHDRRCALVHPECYAQAGGRIETDLFGELPSVLLDPNLLSDLWLARARELALPFEAEGMTVHVTLDDYTEMPDDLEPLGYRSGTLDPDQLADWSKRREAYLEAFDAASNADTTSQAAAPLLADLIRARIAQDQAGVGGRVATYLVLSPHAACGLEVRVGAPIEPELNPETADGERLAVDDVSQSPSSSRYAAPVVEAEMPDIQGTTHALHAARTDVATRGLIRALADDPGTALVVLIARLFHVLVLRTHLAQTDSASTVRADAYGPTGTQVVASLDGVVRERLDARRAACQASGDTVLAWIGGLPHGEKMALLAELTAISLDLREARTDRLRRRARSEAAEIAALCYADISLYWTPDTPYLSVHPKPQLLEMLVAMRAQDVRAGGLKKAELVGWVAEQAADRSWAPACLSWTAAAEVSEASDPEPCDPEPSGETPDAGDAPTDTGGPGSGTADDGAGAYALTDAGLEVLGAAA